MSQEGEPLIRVTGLSYRYPSGTLALRDVSLAIAAGEFVAVIGQNGAGKTTFTKHLNGLLKPTTGDLVVAGINTRQARTSQLARRIGYVFQNPDHQIFSDSVRDEVAFGPRNVGFRGAELEAAVQRALEAVGLWPQRERHPYALSKGERQRLALASIIAMQPDVFVIDEPTTGQDYRQSRQIMHLLRQQHAAGRTVIAVTHDMSIVAEYTQRTLLVGQGQLLADGPTREVLGQFELLRQTNLHPPQITLAAAELGLPFTALTVPEVRAYVQRERGALSAVGSATPEGRT